MRILTINGHLIEKPSLGRAGRSGAGCSESSVASTRTASSIQSRRFSDVSSYVFLYHVDVEGVSNFYVHGNLFQK